jgi:lipid-binding SYLF domain-containing protein
MKNLFSAFLTTSILSIITISFLHAQSAEKKKEIKSDSQEAKSAFLKEDSGMSKFFNGSYGYVIFPNVGKGGFGVGGAAGNGAVYEQGNFIGYAKLTQVSIGFQAGGQAYREVIFLSLPMK